MEGAARGYVGYEGRDLWSWVRRFWWCCWGVQSDLGTLVGEEEGVTGGGEGSVLGVGVIKEKAVEYGDLRTFS